jgi:spore coat polysaccharide biosynthesis protein SpsF
MMKDLSSRKVAALIQARMASSRLPGKVLKELNGRPILSWVVERARRSVSLDQVVVATTVDSSDDPIAVYCSQHQIPVFRGSHHDVLDRYYQAAQAFSVDVVVRLTADCPLIDPELIDKTVQEFEVGNYDYVTNRLPAPWGRSFPIGLDVEVFSFQALENVWSAAAKAHHREHVTPYFYEDIPSETLRFSPGLIDGSREYVSKRGYRVKLLHHEKDLGELRWTVDTLEDLELARELVSRFERDDFSWLDVLETVKEDPSLREINAGVVHKSHRDIDQRG